MLKEGRKKTEERKKSAPFRKLDQVRRHLLYGAEKKEDSEKSIEKPSGKR